MEHVCRCWNNALTTVSRTKSIDLDKLNDSQLHRCLSVFDLIALGVGSTLGAGIYILVGQVAKTQTGPAVILSFAIAALASFLAGICYAEFAARVPKAGSAYVYSYVSVGELWAFIIGWNLILENMIGAASSGKAWSQYFDSVINDTIRRSIQSHVGNITVTGFDSYPDFLAMGLLIVATAFVSVGVKMSSTINLVFTVVNLAVIVCIIGVGSFYANINNWTHSPGGFFPFHFQGVIAGAATCFYSFIGFDTIATSGEESTVPTKHLPIAIVSTLLIALAAYLGVSAILTLLVPWNQLADSAALAKAFAQVGIVGAEYIIAVGALCGLTSSMMGSIFPLPRAVYAMAQDGLIFGWLGYVNSWTGTPLIASCLSGVLVALSALVFDLEALVQMMSIGTLMAYALVSVSVLVLHYQREQVGMTASDEVAASCSTTCNGATATSTAAAASSSTKTVSMTEDTGLLRIADPTNRVRYVPTKTTTVVKRIKPSADSDEDQPTNSSSMQSSQVVAERTAAELHQQRHLANTDANCIDNSSSYRRLDSDCSIDSLSQLFNAGIEASARPTGRSRRIAILCITVISMVWTIFCLLTVYAWSKLVGVEWWAVTLATCCLLILLSLIILLARQPRDDTRLHFRVPFVPWIPLASVLINIYLMVTLSTATWIRFAVWMTLGMIIYLSYGVWHSTERRKPDDNNDTSQVILYDIADKNSLIIDGVYR